jgi:O-succinylbenzoic acid--CoA ligase
MSMSIDTSQASESFKNDLEHFLNEWENDSLYIKVHTSGSTGKPKEMLVEKQRMRNSARITCDFLQLKAGDTALLCMPLDFIAGKMMVVRALERSMNLIAVTPSSHPLRDLGQSIQFAAMVPLQVFHTLEDDEETKRLKQIERLIIGGGAIDKALEEKLHTFPHAVYSTYGMTETLSHIALRRLSGKEASDHYIPFPSVHLSLSDEQTLVIDAPLVAKEAVHTNDIATIYPDGSFTISGRRDNIICSGGIKIQIEEVERKLRSDISSNFAITAVKDAALGEAVVLLIEKTDATNLTNDLFMKSLTKYERPKRILTTQHIPQTPNGKIDRTACRKIAEKLINTKQ